MNLFFAVFFLVYFSANYYIFIRGWQALAGFAIIRPVYLILFLFGSLSYLAAKIFEKSLSSFLYDVFMWAGSFWFALMLYFILSVLLIDLIRAVNWQLNFFPAFIKNNYELTKQITFAAVLLITGITVAAGYLNTRNIVVNDINLPAQGNLGISGLNIVMASDLHMSVVNDGRHVENIVERINSLNPDIVLIPGDIVDDKAFILKDRGIGYALRRLKSKYGIYASNGNHEFINDVESADEFMRETGIKVLRDETVLIDNKFYVAAREDRSMKQFTGKERKQLSEILEGNDETLPVLLMDHTPLGLEEAMENNIYLQVSGHTHHGQLWPLNYITGMIYEISWGYKRKADTHYYVTSGVGTWGPPVRLGSDSEIVNIKINK